MQDSGSPASTFPASSSLVPNPARRTRRVFASCLGLIGLTLLAALGLARMLADHRERTQTQSDPHVATVWMLGVTYGPNHTLKQGSPVQKWLNARGIHALGDYRELTSQYTGEPGSVQFWFDYRSFVPGAAELECHRVGETAFVDDLGQQYHGFLDLQGRPIGIYLPGYDHAAHRLTCTIHWMPRNRPNLIPGIPGVGSFAPRLSPSSGPVSAPMTFTLDLPPAPRVLPPAQTLSRAPVSVTKNGVTVTVGDARLRAPHLGPSRISQRDLTFHLDVKGGRVAATNAVLIGSAVRGLNPFAPGGGSGGPSFGSRQTLLFRPGLSRRLFPPSLLPTRAVRPLTITDPFGVSLIPQNETLAPEIAPPDAPTTVWLAPVNSAGRGTDAIRLRFDVQPDDASQGSPSSLIPFDITIPVQTDDDV